MKEKYLKIFLFCVLTAIAAWLVYAVSRNSKEKNQSVTSEQVDRAMRQKHNFSK